MGTLRRIAAGAALAAGLITISVAPAWAQKARPERSASSRVAVGRGGFRLFAGATSLDLVANRVYCGLDDAGRVCTMGAGGSLPGGGWWPRGTPDQYIFKSGIQIAGIIPSSAGFAWAGDTVGAWAIDTRGPGEHMQSVTGIYNSLSAGDLAAWPLAAYLRDTSLFGEALIGRKAASEQDTWVRYWDGDTTRLVGRRHTMGLLIEQRTLAWTYPDGIQDLVYVLFRFTNVTASSPTPYTDLSRYGYSPADIAEVAALGAEFQRLSERKFGIAIPDGGYTIKDLYAAYTADMDVGDATNNYASVELPFAMGLAYKSDFRESTWQYPTEIFGVAPFAQAPGFVGTKFLQTPPNPATGTASGLVTFATYTGASAPNALFTDPLNIYQGYRYFSGTPSAATGDNGCQLPPGRHLCYLAQSPADARFMQSTGPFTLAPGQSAVMALALVYAPAVATNPGRPSYNLAQYVGNVSMVPGVPPAGDRLIQGLDTLRVLDAALGWVSHADSNGNGAIEEAEVATVRGSLLDKARAAQALFENRFVLPLPPEPPRFFLVPGNDRVTVVWQRSTTETTGDPYYQVASDPTSALYDPNFRFNDVEGYRVWRGASPDRLELLAQYDYAGTAIADYTGDFHNGDYNDAGGVDRCAPELGITASCPVAFTGTRAGPHHDIPLVVLGTFFPGAVQIPRGGRYRMANDSAQYARGEVAIARADTAVTGRASGFPPLRDTGVPFGFVDSTVRNGARYYYAVTTFDVNSLRSGASSLESPASPVGVTPRMGSGQETSGFSAVEFIGSDGRPVPPIPMPSLDPATGIFSGPMPPADVTMSFTASFVPQLVKNGSLLFTMDSVAPGAALNGVDGTYYFTLQGSGAVETVALPVRIDPFSREFTYGREVVAAAADAAQAARFGGDSTYSLYADLVLRAPGTWRLTSWGRGSINGDPSNSDYNGPRWWSGSTNENTNDPNGSHCPGSPGGCVQSPLTRTAGTLPGVTTLFHLLSYNTVPNVPMRNLEGITSYVARAADMKLYWGAAGKIDSVVDETHGVQVPFKTTVNASWGVLNTASFAATTQASTADGNNGLVTWSDVFCVAPVAAYISQCGGAAQTPAVFQNTAVLDPIAATSSTYAGAAALTQSGTGFILYLNGHFFLMQMAALPAAGTVWNARFYAGTITGRAAARDFSFTPASRPLAVPGMRVRMRYEGTSFTPGATTDSLLARIHTVPDPFYGSSVRGDPNGPHLIRFVNVPSRSIIRIYSSSGILVALLTNNDLAGGGEVAWDVTNRGGRRVASGVYFYHVETPDRRSRVGRFMVVQ